MVFVMEGCVPFKEHNIASITLLPLHCFRYIASITLLPLHSSTALTPFPSRVYQKRRCSFLGVRLKNILLYNTSVGLGLFTDYFLVFFDQE